MMGVPRGGEDVPYNLPTEADIELGIEMFGELEHTPKMTDVLDLITSSVNFDEKFKRMWLMLAGNTVIAPTTSNKISPRWYGVLQNINRVKDLNWSKFIADELHKALSKGKPTKGCLLFYNLLYIDAIDLTSLGIALPDGAFAINVWTKEKISEVLSRDVQADGISYGKLPLKPQFVVDFCLFGGLQGLGKFMCVHVPPNCSDEKLAKASELVVRFSSGLVGLLGDLVQGFISLDDEGSSHVSHRLDTDLKAISFGTRNMAKPPPACRTCQRDSLGKNIIDESDSDNETQDNNNDDSGDDDDTDFQVFYHGEKGHTGSSSRSGAVNVASGSGVANVDAPHSDDANAKSHDRVGGIVEGTPDGAGDEPMIESQFMPTATSNTISSGSGDGVLSQRDMTDTQFDLATDSSMERCSAQLANTSSYEQKRENLRLPSLPCPASPPRRAQLSDRDIHLSIMKLVIQELAIAWLTRAPVRSFHPQLRLSRFHAAHPTNKSVHLRHHLLSQDQASEIKRRLLERCDFSRLGLLLD